MKPIHSASSGAGRSIPASAAAQLRKRSIAVVISPVSRSRLDRSLSTSLCVSSSNSTRTNNSGLQNRLKYSVFTYDSVHPVCIANSPSKACKYLFWGDDRRGLRSEHSTTARRAIRAFARRLKRSRSMSSVQIVNHTALHQKGRSSTFSATGKSAT